MPGIGSSKKCSKTIAERTGMSLRYSTNQREVRLPLHEPAPIPFWTAIDRLGLKSVYQRTLEHPASSPLSIFETEPMWKFTSTSGPFQVVVDGPALAPRPPLDRGAVGVAHRPLWTADQRRERGPRKRQDDLLRRTRGDGRATRVVFARRSAGSPTPRTTSGNRWRNR